MGQLTRKPSGLAVAVSLLAAMSIVAVALVALWFAVWAGYAVFARSPVMGGIAVSSLTAAVCLCVLMAGRARRQARLARRRARRHQGDSS